MARTKKIPKENIEYLDIWGGRGVKRFNKYLSTRRLEGGEVFFGRSRTHVSVFLSEPGDCGACKNVPLQGCAIVTGGLSDRLQLYILEVLIYEDVSPSAICYLKTSENLC